jgi:hypothetical protein
MKWSCWNKPSSWLQATSDFFALATVRQARWHFIRIRPLDTITNGAEIEF